MDEEVKKQIDELTELNSQLLKRVEEAAPKLQALAGLEAKFAKLAKAAEGDACKMTDGSDGVMDANGECVVDEAEMNKRAAIPDEIKKQLDSQAEEIKKAQERATASEAKIAKMEDEKIAKAYVEKAGEYKHLPIKPDEFGPVLRKAEAGLDDAGKAELNRVLKAASAAMQAAMGEVGRGGSGDNPGSAFSKMEALADKLREGSTMTREQAFAKALTANPQLAAKVREEEARSH